MQTGGTVKESAFSQDQHDFDTVASWEGIHLALISGLIV